MATKKRTANKKKEHRMNDLSTDREVRHSSACNQIYYSDSEKRPSLFSKHTSILSVSAQENNQ